MARMKGTPKFCIASAEPYAPSAQKPAWPIEIWPAMPTRMFRLSATSAYTIVTARMYQP